MRRTAHRSENVRRRGSIGRVWRLAQKAAQSSAPAEAAATWKRLAWLGRRVCRLVPKYMPDERFGRRGYYGSSSRTATCARSRSLGATLTPACARQGEAERPFGSASLKRRVSCIMETSRNYSNAELRKVSVRDRGRECCGQQAPPPTVCLCAGCGLSQMDASRAAGCAAAACSLRVPPLPAPRLPTPFFVCEQIL